MRDVKLLEIAYRALSRIDEPRARQASLNWIVARMASDEKRRDEAQRVGIDRMTRDERKQLSAIVGNTAVGLIGTMMIAGGTSARRTCEVSGPLDADITLFVKRR